MLSIIVPSNGLEKYSYHKYLETWTINWGQHAKPFLHCKKCLKIQRYTQYRQMWNYVKTISMENKKWSREVFLCSYFNIHFIYLMIRKIFIFKLLMRKMWEQQGEINKNTKQVIGNSLKRITLKNKIRYKKL